MKEVTEFYEAEESFKFYILVSVCFTEKQENKKLQRLELTTLTQNS